MSIESGTRKVCSGAILQTPDLKAILHLRDNTPGIAYPGMISVFGGGAMPDETPYQAMLRELIEETDIDPALLSKASFIGRVIEPASVLTNGIESAVDLYTVPNCEPKDLKVLEGAGHVIIPRGGNIDNFPPITETAQFALTALWSARTAAL